MSLSPLRKLTPNIEALERFGEGTGVKVAGGDKDGVAVGITAGVLVAVAVAIRVTWVD